MIRRQLLQIAGAAFVLCNAERSTVFAGSVNQTDLPRPNPAIFQPGDFVWPKKPDAYVPYNSGGYQTPDEDAQRWTAEKERFIRNHSGSSDEAVQRAIAKLSQMDWREFVAVYEGGQKPGTPGVYSGGGVYVGHVGIIDIATDGTPYVIEALWKPGVVRTSYSDWIRQRSDEMVWLARLRERSLNDRAKVATEASRHLGMPYDFWNFNLDDDRSFYCSKLCWLSAYRALGLAVDDNPNPKRDFWFSPKQFLGVSTIDKIFDPGPYAFR